MLSTSEYEPDILIIIVAQAILYEKTGVRLRSLGHEAEVQLNHLAHLRLRELN
jgi:hypothetical protein